MDNFSEDIRFLPYEHEPKTAKNRLHLDLTGAGWREGVDRALSLGATSVSEHAEYGTQWVTLRDPEGNEFDIGAGLGEADN